MTILELGRPCGTVNRGRVWTEESNYLTKLKEAADAKIDAFIEMLAADARLLTEGGEITSHDLFAKINLEEGYHGGGRRGGKVNWSISLRSVRSATHIPSYFARIKRLPKKDL